MTEAPSQPVVPALRHNRNYRWIWIGQTVSLLGDEVLDTAIVLWLGIAATNGLTSGPPAAAGALAARIAPVLVFGMIGGVYADRWDRRRTMLITDAIRAGLVFGLAVLLLIGPDLPIALSLGAIYGVIALCSVAAQFFNPARYGLLAVIVADADRERMGSITAGTSALASIVGPALAAILLVVADVQWALLITSAGFVMSFAAVSKVRAPRVRAPDPETAADPPRMGREVAAGVRFFAGSRVLKVMLATSVVVVFGVYALNTLDVFFVIRNLHAPVGVYGLLGAVFGLGLLVGAGLAAVFAAGLTATRVYSYGFLLVGMLLIAYSRMTTPLGAIIVLFLTGIPVAAVNSMIGPLLMRSTPVHLMGRVSAVLQPVTHLASLAAVALAAWLAGTVLRDLDITVAGVHLGTIDTIFLGAGVVIALTGAWAARALRHDLRQNEASVGSVGSGT
jgi:MFS family permease